MFKKLNLTQEDRKYLIVLLAIGLFLRLYAFSQIYIISIDGAFQYIPVAKLFFQGKYLQALLQPQLPLYPFLISILSYITRDLEVSGQLISIIFSLLAVFPLYLIGKSLFGARAGFWTAVFYIFHPMMLQCSVDVLKEALLIFLLLSAVYCSLRFLQEGERQWLIWTVVFAIVGALVRVITLEVLIILGLWLGYRALRERVRDKKLAYRYLWIVIVVIGVIAAFVIPGIWGWEFFVEKKPYSRVTNILNNWLIVYQWPSVSQLGAGALTIIGKFVEKAYPVPFLLALFGLGWRLKNREFSTREKYCALLMGALVIIFFPLLNASYRYLLPAIFLLYLWAGFGLVKIWELIDRKFTKYPKRNAFLIIMVLLITSIPFTLQPQRLDKIGRKEVGLWLWEQSFSSPVIMTNIPRVAYYAGGKYESIPLGIPTEKIVQRAKWKKADYLVIEEKGNSLSQALIHFENKGDLKLIYRYPYGDKRRVVSVYQIGR
jgi:4-amino-4-deoxy-L-arabinose transferase-like glycosyltransferase